ncbi:hypothetical protein NON00_17390 [Roseomonas sp. GC11]|uniref:hypothetical protein n=1 Tax=Roseomonas sp. GC11 TaxID=2950546 RepID=UPI00210BAFF6|nr:hypothetical protein [Roseomonas sp. GC11]MCQ4161691.1 hypothetical protein [Roseomonas sp. GC11]
MFTPDQGHFTRSAVPEGVAFTIRPARPSRGFQAAALLLVGLFGLPVLAVLIDPRRHDVVSLGAALAGLAVTVLALLALRRSRQGRAPRRLLADAAGLALPEGERLPWSAVRALRLEQPEPGRHAATAPGMHALAARIAARQHAAETRLWADLAPPDPPRLLAAGLGPEVAEALRAALLAERPQ